MTDWFSELAPQAQPSQAPQSAPSTDWFGELGGSNAQPQTDPNATPDAPSWFGRRVQDIQGKQDPRFKGLPALKDALQQEGSGSADVTRPMALSAFANASDTQMSDIARKALGPRYLGSEKDANGYEVVHYRGADGQPKSAYLNQPGLDLNDIERAAAGSLPFMAIGGGIGAFAKGAPLAVQALAQGAGAAGASVAGDVAQIPLGADTTPEFGKAVGVGAFGAAAPFLGAGASALWRKLVTEPGLFDAAAGKLTSEGEKVAKEAGIDPAQMSKDAASIFARTYSMTGDAAKAATRSDIQPFGIPATVGQVSKSKSLLTSEEAMRRGIRGDDAERVMMAFDKEQQQAVKDAALGTKPNSIARNIAPNRMFGDTNPQALGTSIREGATQAKEAARAAEGEAWQNVPELKPTAKALDTLPDVLNNRLADVHIDSEITPAAAKMAQEVDRFISGEAPEQVAKVLKNNPVKTVDQMRRRLLSLSRGASTGEDKRAASSLYDGFNDWIDQAASQNLLDGDVGAAAQLKVARGFTREVREIFQPSGPGGRASPAARRLAEVMDEGASPESVVNKLLGASGSRGVDQGTTQAVTNFKQALDRFAPPDVAKSTWDDVRLAYWTRLVQGRNGELLGPTAMLNNIKTAFANQRSIVQSLYTPEEQKLIQQFRRALETISYTPPNASGSGYTAVGLAQDAIGKLFNSVISAFGLNTKAAQTALALTGVPKRYGEAAAKAAVNQAVKARPANLAPAIVGGGAAVSRDRNGR